jgi:hypothetical protein
MAKITGSLVLVLLVMAIMSGHIEAAGRGAEPGKDGGDYNYKSEKFLPVFECPILYTKCFIVLIPIACSLYHQLCPSVQDHAPNHA